MHFSKILFYLNYINFTYLFFESEIIIESKKINLEIKSKKPVIRNHC